MADLDMQPISDDATFQRIDFTGAAATASVGEGAEFNQCRIRQAQMNESVLDNVTMTDCLIEDSNLANMRSRKPSLVRVRIASTRLTGLQLTSGGLREVHIEDCRTDLSSFRFSSFQNVLFEQSNLRGADFQNADLRGASFKNCDLTGAQFSAAKMTGTRFYDCHLEGVGGIGSMSGAIVTPRDIAALAYHLAEALGIRVE